MTKKKTIPWLLLTPCLLVMIALVLYPVIRTFVFSLFNYKLTEPDNINFIGFSNYMKVINSPDFHLALSNSIYVLIVCLIISLIASITVGMLLNRESVISPILTAIAIIPWALPPLVNGIIWKFIFHPGNGLANRILLATGIINNPISWTSDKYLLLFVIAIVLSWRVVPFCSILILANLQNIPKELYEAARVDGSSKLQEFQKITLPMLMPSMSIVLIQITMAAINVFDEIVAIAGYKLDSQTLLIYNYLNTFSFLDFGYGSAISYTIMLISGIFGYFYIKTMSREAKKE